MGLQLVQAHGADSAIALFFLLLCLSLYSRRNDLILEAWSNSNVYRYTYTVLRESFPTCSMILRHKKKNSHSHPPEILNLLTRTSQCTHFHLYQGP